MNTSLITATAIVALLTAPMSLADDDCREPTADWQPREVLRQKLESDGWKVQRIKVDDGCYEVEGLDADGNRVEAEYAPASLRLRKLETEYFDREG